MNGEQGEESLSSREVQLARAFTQLIDAAVDFDKWPVFLESLSHLFEARGAHVAHFDYNNSKLTFSAKYGFDHVDAAMLRKFEELTPEDPRVPFGRRHPAMPVTIPMTVDEETWRASRMYREFWKPIGAEHSVAVHFPGENGVASGIAVVRGPEDAPFDETDCELMGAFVPALKRAFELHRRLAELDFGERAAFEALDALPIGLFLADEMGRVRFANRAAREISNDGDGFGLDGERFFTHAPEERSRMLDYIGQAVHSAREDQILPAEGLNITRPSGALPYEVVIATVWGNHIRFGLGLLDDPVAVIHVTDPDRPQEAQSELLQRLFGLTPAEARVVERVVAGKSVAEIVEELGLSQYTVRQHLSVAFEKTGTKRQSQLVKRVLSTPIWVKAQEQREKFSQTRKTISKTIGQAIT